MYRWLLCFRYLRTRYIALASIISVTLRKGEKIPEKSHFTVFDCFDGTLLNSKSLFGKFPSGIVQHDGVQFRGRFQGFAVFEQDTHFGTFARAGHDGRRCGQA